ncbi:leukocyte receptor cluster member 1 [Ischnura elegans]|uniref:leukocyte receptor cluster member 1 n=1 Tax=Ischnura elegans TaxID=197161 RepID=UPI001ED87374|nr:leukocyte receptor cluster member 1 [Ischnura elegans]
MNILPKKRWHVRTKENIARVRKDEAEAAEKEKETQRKILLAEKEARTALLREKARKRFAEGAPEDADVKPSSSDGHVNFFEDTEQGIKDYGVNIEHEKEKREEKEKYEKSIGYLTYLGQNTVEATGEISWYNKIPERLARPDEDEKSAKIQRKKELSDPLNEMCKYLQLKEGKAVSISLNSCSVGSMSFGVKRKREDVEEEEKHAPGVSKRPRKDYKDREKVWKKKMKKKHRKHKRNKSKRHRRNDSTSGNGSSCDLEDSQEERKAKLERLRQERLKREAVEAEKARALIAKAKGEPIEESKEKKAETDLLFPSQKYNSQFNPHLARQNFSKADPFSVQPT